MAMQDRRRPCPDVDLAGPSSGRCEHVLLPQDAPDSSGVAEAGDDREFFRPEDAADHMPIRASKVRPPAGTDATQDDRILVQ